MAIQMNVSGLRRNLKNIAHNYTDAQVKVREATSNDPWGPSSTLMSEIADLTYNVVAFSEIMQMIWKRLNDHGRNWRHVYKALVLLEYLIKTGSEKIADQCKENIFAIQTLKDFQYLEENKDMGISVREKAKTLVALLKDEERLRNERVRALKAKERFAQSVSAIGSDSDINSPSSPCYPDTIVTSSARHDRQPYGVTERPLNATELENARPQTAGEEELQLQLALAMSKEEADQEEAKRKSDDVRLQMALSESEANYQRDRYREKEKSALKDLLDINFNPNGVVATSSSMSTLPSNSSVALDPWGVPVASTAPSSGSMSPQNVTAAPPASKSDPWGMPLVDQETNTPKQNDPWSSTASAPSSRVTSPPTTNDPWAPVPSKSPEPPALDDPWTPKPTNDPWSSVGSGGASQPTPDPFAPVVTENSDDFNVILSREKPASGVDDAFELGDLGLSLAYNSENGLSKSKSPTAFLGENSGLVNLDNLVSTRPAPVGMGGTTSPSYQNMKSLSHLNNNYPNGSTFATELDFGTTASTNKVASVNINHNNYQYQQQQQQHHHITTPTTPISIISNNNINNNNNSNMNNPFLSQSLPNSTLAAHTPSLVPGINPFSGPSPPNPFQAQQAPKPSLNEMRTPTGGLNSPWGPSPTGMNNLDEGGQFMI